MPIGSVSGSSSKKEQEAQSSKSFDLRSYVESEDQMLPIHKIDHELMPAVLNHLSKLKSLIPETHDSLLKRLDTIKSNLIDVRDAISSVKDLERLLNVQIKELVRVDLDDISEEMDAIVVERQTASQMDSTRSEPRKFQSKKKISGITQIHEELSQLDLTIPKLKDTLNWTPKISSSANLTRIQPSPSIKPSESMEGINVFTSFAESLDRPLLSTMSHLPAAKEIRMLYDSLDVRLKICLLCFSVFPDNSVVNKRVLTNWWIGEGFIESPSSSGETAENTAFELLKGLMDKGFIEPVYRKRYPVAHKYKMHPFVRFVVVMLAQKEGFFDIDSAGNFLAHPANSRKAILVRTEEGSSQDKLRDCPDLKELKTLFNVNESYLDLQSDWFAKLKYVGVLQLGRWQSSTKHHTEVENTDFLKSLRNMTHLRYLSLQGISRIAELPVSFSNLANMRVLDIRACHNLQKLPDGIGKLKNLTHFDMSECHWIGHMPKELASLTELQVLKGFVVDATKITQDVCTLTELSRLQKLRKLSLYIREDASAKHGELFNSLPRFTALLSLTITWVGVLQQATQKPPLLKSLISMKSRSKERSTEGAATTNIHQSLGNLQKLDLRCFPWTWLAAPLDPMELKSLKKLYIRGGELRVLHQMGHCCNVEILRLKHLGKLALRWENLQASFPRLTYLEKVSCPNLSLFPCDGSGVWMKKSSNSNQA